MLKQNDIVRYNADQSSMGIKKGTLAVVIDARDSFADVRLLDGAFRTPAISYLDKVYGRWVPFRDYPGVLVKGETLVRLNQPVTGGGPRYPRVNYTKGSIFVYDPYELGHREDDIFIGTRAYSGKYSGRAAFSFACSNFEVFVEEGQLAPARTEYTPPVAAAKRAMAFGEAVPLCQKLNEETGNQGLYRVRQRTWDKNGRYAAIDKHTGLGSNGVVTSFYLPGDVDAELQRIVESRAPIDVFAQPATYSPNFQFFTKEGNAITNPRGNGTLWTQAEVLAQPNAIATIGGRKYRLCCRVRIRIEGHPLAENVDKTEVVPLLNTQFTHTTIVKP